MKSKEINIKGFEPYLFIFFGIFHIHRIWGLFDRRGYASFWLDLMTNRGLFYYLLMATLIIFCILGIIEFIKDVYSSNLIWYRWIYIFAGSYLLCDLLAIEFNISFWQKLVLMMYDIFAWYWNILWSIFIIMGMASLLFGINLMKEYNKQKVR